MESKKLTILTTGNSSGNYIGGFTKIEQRLIKENIVGTSINLFSGNSLIGETRVDFSSKKATINQDVFVYLENNKEHFDSVILDPCYNERYAKQYAKISSFPNQFIIFAGFKGGKTTLLFNLIRQKINPTIIILKSWNYYEPKGYSDNGSYLLYPGGFRKSIILMVTKKINQLEV